MVHKPTWIAQRRYKGQAEYFLIINPIKTQQLLHDVTRILLYGYIYNGKQGLNAYATPFFPYRKENSKNPRKEDPEESRTTKTKSSNIKAATETVYNIGVKTPITQQTSTKNNQHRENQTAKRSGNTNIGKWETV